MTYLTDEKLAILGLTMRLTPNVTMYDPFEQGNQGAAEEIYHCSFPGARVSWTADVAAALEGAAFLISSGGAPRKEGMTTAPMRASS
jgi:malate dehydrogenase